MAGGIRKAASSCRPASRFSRRDVSREDAQLKDDVLLRGIAAELEHDGVTVVESTLFCGALVPRAGTLTRATPRAKEWEDVRFGFRVAKDIGRGWRRDAATVFGVSGRGSERAAAARIRAMSAWTPSATASSRSYGPRPIVKDIFIKPEETVGALRATCRNLTISSQHNAHARTRTRTHARLGEVPAGGRAARRPSPRA